MCWNNEPNTRNSENKYAAAEEQTVTIAMSFAISAAALEILGMELIKADIA